MRHLFCFNVAFLLSRNYIYAKSICYISADPSSFSFQDECVYILAGLWNAPPTGFFGTATTGSSEAVLLGGLAMKRQWQTKNPDRLNSRPNVIIGANAHICVNKFADYFDVEARIVPVSERTRFTIDVRGVEERLDGNTGMTYLQLSFHL